MARAHLSEAGIALAKELGLSQAAVMELISLGWMYVSDLRGERWERHPW